VVVPPLALIGVMVVTEPGPGATVATPGLLLLQVPPASASDSVMVDPKHKVEGPSIAVGSGLIVTVFETEQAVAVTE